jgi:hypothetical protein
VSGESHEITDERLGEAARPGATDDGSSARVTKVRRQARAVGTRRMVTNSERRERMLCPRLRVVDGGRRG